MSYLERWKSSLELIQHLRSLDIDKKLDLNLIKKSIIYARKYHGRQLRQSGEPYYTHPLEVAFHFANYTASKNPFYFSTELIITAILHDTLEDTSLTATEISQQFGKEVSNGVEFLSRNKADFKISAAEVLENLTQNHQYGLAIIKIFDRIHNLQSLAVKSPEKAKKTIEETIKFFLVFCIYIEDRTLENDLRKWCYKYLDTQNYSPSFFADVDLFPKELSFSFQSECLTEI